MSKSFKKGQLVKFLPDVLSSKPDAPFIYWAKDFSYHSDIFKVFVVSDVMMHMGCELVQLLPQKPKDRCKRNWWVPSYAFAPHTPDWLEDLPVEARYV